MLQENQTKSVQFWYKLAELIGAQWIARAVAVVSILFVSAMIFAQVAPAAGEAWVYNITLFSGILTACLLAIVCLMVLSVGVNLTTLIIGAGIKQAKEMNAPTQALLPATTDTDLIIIEQPGEGGFAERMNYELSGLASGRYAAVIRFRNPKILYLMNGKESLILRDTLSPGSAALSTTETMDAYDAFVADAIAGINDHFRTIRAQLSDNLRSVFADTAARIASIILLIALPFALFAQSKTERVQNGVPQIAGQVFPAKTFVRFDFAKGGIERFADGSATLAQLVAQSRPGADADNMGEFKGAVVGTTYYEAKKNEQPQPLFTSNMVPHNMAVSIPDSVKVVAGIEEIKQALPFYKTKVWVIVRPVVEFVYWLLLYLGVVLLAVIGFFNLVSRSAAENGNLSPSVQRLQIQFASYAWYCAMALAGTVFILFSLTVFFWEWHPLLSAVLIWAGMLVAKFIVNRLTPNGQHQRQVTTTYKNSGPALPHGK